MESLTFHDLKLGRQEKLKRIVENITPLNYGPQFNGKRLNDQHRDVISVPVGNELRALFRERHGKLELAAILTHEDYNNAFALGQVAFTNRLLNGVTPFAEATQREAMRSAPSEPPTQEDVAAAETQRTAEQDIVSMKPIAKIVREWMNNHAAGHQFTSQDIINSRPALKDKRQALAACLYQFRGLGYMEETGSTLGTEAAPLKVYRLLPAGVNAPEEEQHTSIRGKILAWLKQRPVGSTVVVARLAEEIGLDKREATSLGGFLIDLKSRGVLPVVGHEKTKSGRLTEKLQITQALIDWFPTPKGHKNPASTTASSEQPVADRKPRQIMSDIQRELQELYDKMSAKVEAAAEKAKKLTDYTEDELFEALQIVRRKARKSAVNGVHVNSSAH